MSSTVVPGRPPWADPDRLPSGFVPFPVDAVESSIGARLAEVADQHGDRLALRGPAGERTYTELQARVAGGAEALRARLGDTPTPVAVVAAHDTPLVEGLLSVVAAGHTALVLDPSAPTALSAALLADAGVGLLLADGTHRGLAEELAEGRDVGAIGDWDDGADVAAVDPSTPALLAYTSGTSGSPKAAVVPHRQLLGVVRGATDTLAVHPEDRLPMLFPLSLAVAAYPALLPLLTGASLTSFDVLGQGFGDLPGFLASEDVTVAYLAPTVVRFLEGSVGETTFPHLRLVVLGGERVDRGAVDLTRQLFGEDLLVANGYGTTETGVLTFWFDAPGGTGGDDPHAAADGTLPAGFPIDGMTLAVADDDGDPVPDGDTGELVVTGRSLFAGYRGHPELDELVLERDDHTGESTYRTGDLARLRPDGALELVGRVDTQVKVRGRRVVLGEVEELLLGLPTVNDAAVVAGRDPAGHVEVVAHVVPQDAAETVDRLRAEVAALAPPQMVPARFVLHGALPQLPNGKLDRQALGRDERDRPRLATAYEAAGDELEAELVALWEEALVLSPVGVDDDFFDLGGNSLLAGWMLVELETRLGHRVPMAAMLDATTVRGLAAAIHEVQRGERRSDGLVVIQEGDPSRPTLFVTHDLLGSVFRYGNLAEALGPDQPVVGFESPALTGERFPFTRIETLALRYVTELRRHQPEGPYHLCGYSFGGILAFEMARHLRRAGAEVALLALVDIGPGYRGIDYGRERPPIGPSLDVPAPPDRDAGRLQRARHLAGVVRRHPRATPSYLVHTSRWRQRLLPLRWRTQLRDGGRIPARHRLWYAYQCHWSLVGPDWAGAPYDGEIELYWCEETGSTDATMGWGALGAAVDVHRIAVPHEQVLDRDRVHHLADPLREAIDRS